MRLPGRHGLDHRCIIGRLLEFYRNTKPLLQIGFHHIEYLGDLTGVITLEYRHDQRIRNTVRIEGPLVVTTRDQAAGQ